MNIYVRIWNRKSGISRLTFVLNTYQSLLMRTRFFFNQVDFTWNPIPTRAPVYPEPHLYAPSMTMDVSCAMCFLLACSPRVASFIIRTARILSAPSCVCEAPLFRALLRAAITACCGEAHFEKFIWLGGWCGGGEMRSEVPGKRKWIRRLQLFELL